MNRANAANTLGEQNNSSPISTTTNSRRRWRCRSASINTC
jgi:hypothetical protein